MSDQESKKTEVPLADMSDCDITKHIASNHAEPKEECKFIYDPASPYFKRFSYGTFTDCEIPRISMCFPKKSPKIIRDAKFTNVDFGQCVFDNVIFRECFFENCDFSKTLISNLTFQVCLIKNTNVDYPDVSVTSLYNDEHK
jgi:hypothetical protein